MKSVCLVMGTRPEAIKLAPVYRALQGREGIRVQVLALGQHEDVLRHHMAEAGIEPTKTVTFRRSSAGLGYLLGQLVIAAETGLLALTPHRPDLVLVQGDTSSALAGALAAHALGIPVGHVEAGLRTGNPDRPFPEEMNRRLIGRLARLHFPPTMLARGNLQREEVHGVVYMTGNTSVDQVLRMVQQPCPETVTRLLAGFDGRPTILVTCHRREGWETTLPALVAALDDLIERMPDMAIVWPVHPNPLIADRAAWLGRRRPEHVRVAGPVSHLEFAHLLRRSQVVVTDSGGVIEEATTLDVPCVIIRDETERGEAVAAFTAVLVELSDMPNLPGVIGWILQRTPRLKNPWLFGQGDAGLRIAEAVHAWLMREETLCQPA